MAPVQIYAESPINTAAKADGVTPQTAAAPPPAAGQAPTRTAPAAAGAQGSYPPAQPGATPSLPQPTGAASSQRYAPVQPTPTSQLEDSGPPPPQPGAMPQPPSALTTLPPPPKAGEKYQPPEPTPGPQMQSNVAYPTQMGLPAPAAPYTQRGTATASSAASYGGQVQLPGMPAFSPQAGAGGVGGDNYAHPPGYMQNVNAADFSRDQRAAHEASMQSYGAGSSSGMGGSSGMSGEGSDGEEGIWDTAKKWAQAAGEKLSAAENEVWRRINKE
jgi:hypothetical protein